MLLVVFASLLLLACKHPLQASSRTVIPDVTSVINPDQSVAQSLHHIVGLESIDSKSKESNNVTSENSAHDSKQSSVASVMRFCTSTPTSADCSGPAPGAIAQDLGFLPVSLSLDSALLSQVRQNANGWSATIQLRPLVNGISAWCRTGKISIEVTADDRISSTLDSTYCNWLAYGNIVIEFYFSIEELNPDKHMFAGFYELRVKGTTNLAVSGYLQTAFN